MRCGVYTVRQQEREMKCSYVCRCAGFSKVTVTFGRASLQIFSIPLNEATTNTVAC